jgi:hypothetical protein
VRLVPTAVTPGRQARASPIWSRRRRLHSVRKIKASLAATLHGGAFLDRQALNEA